jgi:hypothetical protein
MNELDCMCVYISESCRNMEMEGELKEKKKNIEK